MKGGQYAVIIIMLTIGLVLFRVYRLMTGTTRNGIEVTESNLSWYFEDKNDTVSYLGHINLNFEQNGNFSLTTTNAGNRKNYKGNFVVNDSTITLFPKPGILKSNKLLLHCTSKPKVMEECSTALYQVDSLSNKIPNTFTLQSLTTGYYFDVFKVGQPGPRVYIAKPDGAQQYIFPTSVNSQSQIILYQFFN